MTSEPALLPFLVRRTFPELHAVGDARITAGLAACGLTDLDADAPVKRLELATRDVADTLDRHGAQLSTLGAAINDLKTLLENRSTIVVDVQQPKSPGRKQTK